MKTSARNQFAGTVGSVSAGAVNDEIEIVLPGGATIVAIVTHRSAESLGLKPGIAAIALIKASHVLLAVDLGPTKVSARNQLRGEVRSVTAGAVNSEVTLELDDGDLLVAIVTASSVTALGLAPGVKAAALIKASDVIVAVPS